VKLRFTPSAKTELLSAAKYIHNENPEAALNFLKKADDLLHRLEKHPLSGRTIPEFPGLPYRLKLTAPSVHAFCCIKGVKSSGREHKSAPLGPQLNLRVRLVV